MSLTFDNLTDTQVADAESFLTELLSEQFPSLDLSKGRIFYDLLIKPAALFYALNNANLTQLRESMSLIAANESPDSIDSSILDSVLANLRITRGLGSKASGQLTVIISDNVTTTIPKLTTFTANGIDFVPTDSFIGVTDAISVINSATRLITARSDGTYSFVIDIVAKSTGVSANVQRGTRFTSSPGVVRVVDLVAESGFTGGTNTESNTDLLLRASANLSPKVACSRASTAAMIKEHFSYVSDVSIVGFGDSEMHRDRDNVFGISTGGKADAYVRTRSLPIVTVLTKECTLTDTVDRVLSVNLNREEAAGVYDVIAVLPTSQDLYPESTGAGVFAPVMGSLEIISNTRGVDYSMGSFDFVPSLPTTVSAAYSRFQTIQLTFKHPELNVNGKTVGSKVSYKLYLLKMPGIAEIQDFMSLRANRHLGSDLLIKAPVPCICSASLRLIKTRNTDTIDVSGLRTAIGNKISAATFELGQAPVSQIIDVVYSTLGSRVIVDLPVQLVGRLRKPDGVYKPLISTDRLTIDEVTSLGVSSRTVAFYLDPMDVDITLGSNTSKVV